VLLASVGAAVPGSAETYYVAPTGSDSNLGTTLGSAWKTIVKASNTLVAGDEVIVRDGYWLGGVLYEGAYDSALHDSQYIYRDTMTTSNCGYFNADKTCGSINPRNSGTATDPIVFMNYPGERPHIKGDARGKWTAYGVHIRNKDYVTVEGFEYSDGMRGICVFGRCTGVVIRDSWSHHNGYGHDQNNGGIIVGLGVDSSFNVLVDGCRTWQNGDIVDGELRVGFNTGGFYSYNSVGAVVQNCVFYDEYNGVRLKDGCIEDTIRNNTIYGCRYGVFNGTFNRDCAIAFNVIYDVDYDGVQSQGRAGEPIWGTRIYNNTIYKCNSYAGIHVSSSADRYLPNTQIWNNIVVNCNGPALRNDYDHDDLWSDYNCFYGTTDDRVVSWNQSLDLALRDHVVTNSLDSHSIQQDPLFVNVDARDFHLQPTSPCLGAGMGGSDMGAYGTPGPDISPPIIYGIRVEYLSETSAMVHWNTNEPATSFVEYGFDAGYGLGSVSEAALVTDHSIELTGLWTDSTYHYRVRSTDVEDNTGLSLDQTFVHSEPVAGENKAYNIVPNVSDSYSGYNPAHITDGVIDPYNGAATTWGSTESSSSPHWIEIDFGQPEEIGRVVIYWAWNDFQSQWMTSQQYRIQSWNGSGYEDITVVNNSSTSDMTLTDFPGVVTSRIRIYQPANMGPASYSTILWLTELEIYAVGASADAIPPAAVDDLSALVGEQPGEVRLFWTAPGDDGLASGPAAQYDLRYSDAAITAENWASAAAVPSGPAPGMAGSAESFTVGGLVPNTVYYFALKAADEVPNWSGLSNQAAARAAGQNGDTLAPVIAGLTVIQVTPVSATITWETDEPAVSELLWGLTAAYGSTRDGARTSVTSHSVDLIFLSPNTTYHVCAVCTDPSGNESRSTGLAFTTLPLVTGTLARELSSPSPTHFGLDRPTLKVNNVDDNSANVYFFDLAADPGLATTLASSLPILQQAGSTTSWQIPERLETNQTYYWQVNANNIAFSPVYSFTVEPTTYVYPNPFRPGEVAEAVFSGVPAGKDLIITTVSGDPVRRWTNHPGGDIRWDGTNGAGQPVATEKYLWYVTGTDVRGLIAVIR
jgi:hypothetical protein